MPGGSRACASETSVSSQMFLSPMAASPVGAMILGDRLCKFVIKVLGFFFSQLLKKKKLVYTTFSIMFITYPVLGTQSHVPMAMLLWD